MKALAGTFRRTALWLDQRSPRERVMLLVAVVAVALFSGYAFCFAPQAARHNGLAAQITALNTTITALDAQAEAVKSRAAADPDREQRIRQRQLQDELQALDDRLKTLTVDLISPRDMAAVLRSLLDRQAGMRLVRLENLPAENLLPAAQPTGGAEGANGIHLYRHPVRIVFSGTYLQSLDYLRAIEKLPRKLFFDELEIVVNDHPNTEISLTVHTLSLRKGWIGA